MSKRIIPLCNGGLAQCRKRCRKIKAIPHAVDCYISGAGMGAYYYTGVMYLLRCLEERRKIRIASFHGSSSGAVAAVAYLFGIDPDVWTRAYGYIQREFGRGQYLSHAYVGLLQRHEPHDALERVHGRLHVYATELSFGFPQRCFTTFTSVNDLYQKVVASTSIPFVTIPTLSTTIAGRSFIDGMSIADAETKTDSNGRIRLCMGTPPTYPWIYRIVPHDPCIHRLIQRGWDEAHLLLSSHAPMINTTLTLPLS
jgi:hypothetical protein